MADFITYLSQFSGLLFIVRAAALVAAGFLLASVVTRNVRRFMPKHISAHHATLFTRLIYWLILGLFLASALRQLGFSLSVLLGAAGVLSVAIGFASQTSASNLISGLFLVGEKPFELGDVIKVGDVTGEVLSIDLLSVKLRTFDNLFVRMPNENLIKSQMTNLTRFPIRRFDLVVGVAYHEDIAQVRDVLKSVADRNLLCLDNPEPLFIFTGFGDSSLNIQFSVWAKRENFLALRNSIQEEIKIAFDEAGIEIPFPHRTLYVGSQTDPFRFGSFPGRPLRVSQQPTQTQLHAETEAQLLGVFNGAQQVSGPMVEWPASSRPLKSV